MEQETKTKIWYNKKMWNFCTKEVIAAAVLIMLAGVSYGGYRFRLTVLDLHETKTSLAESQDKAKTLQEENTLLIEANARLAEDLATAKDENANISLSLASEQTKNLMFEGQIKAIGNTVGTLEKLSKTDKELLQKYSKVYFLNENYIPSSLSGVASTSVYEEGKTIFVHAKVEPFLSRLLIAAAANQTPIQIISGYRSFGEQAALKSEYKVVFGSGANAFSADQGYSEHQLGTTVDFTTPSLGMDFTQFSKSKAYAWLVENAYQYGFVLSYPKNNTYYQFEPWHWRFVGVPLATKLYNNKQYFYDLEQREIDAYLVSIFD